MSAYVIATYDVIDPDQYQHYLAGVMPLLHKHLGRVLAADFEATAVEGEARSANIIIQFPSEAAALSWTNDPDYAPVKAIRHASTSNGAVVLTKQFVPPPQ